MSVNQASCQNAAIGRGTFYEGPLDEIYDFRVGHVVCVRPKDGDAFEVVRLGYRRGPIFETEDAAIAQAQRMASEVLVLNKYGKIKSKVYAIP